MIEHLPILLIFMTLGIYTLLVMAIVSVLRKDDSFIDNHNRRMKEYRRMGGGHTIDGEFVRLDDGRLLENGK